MGAVSPRQGPGYPRHLILELVVANETTAEVLAEVTAAKATGTRAGAARGVLDRTREVPASVTREGDRCLALMSITLASVFSCHGKGFSF